MKKVFKIIFILMTVGVVFFLFQSELMQFFLNLQNRYLPCSRSMTYSIGSFDERFNISKEKFLSLINVAEETWEKAIDKELFSYAPEGDGELKINLIYDIRQEASQKLKDIGIVVDETKASYDDLKSRYDVMQIEYKKLKTKLESKVTSFQNRQETYAKEVEYFNSIGGALKNDYVRLNKEKNYLDLEFVQINKLQTEFNSKVNDINTLVVVLNRLVSTLNLEVKKFNTIGSELGGEFEEGTYSEGSAGKRINIFQFDNEGKLARVLTHEFGHALRLGHLENPSAVMNRLNNGVNEKLIIDDILALKEYCSFSVLKK